MKQEFIDRFETLQKANDDPQLLQQRGRDFEELINNIFQEETVLLRKGFHTADNKSEQIDGAIEIDNRIFLIETKWVKSNIAASDLFSFIGKIENKFFGTLGIFISKEKLSENFIDALNKGRRQVVLVIHGEDIDLLFNPKNDIKINEYISHTLRLCSYDNILHFPVKKYLDILKNEKSVEKIENFNEDSIAFIKNSLWKTPILETDLILKINENSEVLNNKIFEKIISMYSDIFNARFTNLKFDYTIIENFDKFLKNFKANTETLKNYS
ncbi:MAG: restriction endonuclease [Chryseobacterium sp.]|uniref:restriction endonuclease n=1 Tax=Chryseobacterium sp. TaxID=1871047 RepID=UPI0025B7E3DD|nr:restriction endonuclease [Chryseobacterium sp.]MCJ7932502.1 restriction endonuclease [Chryseobacterium sp.]